MIVKSWKDGAKVLVDAPEANYIADMYEIVSRIERKIDILARRVGAYTTLEGVTSDEKASLADVPMRFRDGGGR